MTRLPLALCQATPDERNVILELLNDSIRWLQGMGIDQWARPWPDEERRNERIVQDLAEGKTWLVLDGAAVAGTITIDPADNGIWPADSRAERPSTCARSLSGGVMRGSGLDPAVRLGRRRGGARAWSPLDPR